MSRKNITIMSLLVVLLTVWIPGSSSAGPPTDLALLHPGLAKAARDYPQDWEQRVHHLIRPVIAWQRIVGTHAMIAGYSDEEPNPLYLNPKVRIRVARWDGTDLFQLGIPRTYNGKPVQIDDIKDFLEPASTSLPMEYLKGPFFRYLRPNLAGWYCDYERPARGGLSVGNATRSSWEGGTLGGAVYGRAESGWPTTLGWKYLVSNQHVLSPRGTGQEGDTITQPAPSCWSHPQIGYLWKIPEHLKVRTDNFWDPNTQDSALANLVDHYALKAEIRGIGTPAGDYDPPQNGWCGRKSGASTGVTEGCIFGYPGLDYIENWSPGHDAWFKEIFWAGNLADHGDSGSLWLDYDLRVHGMLFGRTKNMQYVAYMRWKHVLTAWTISTATY